VLAKHSLQGILQAHGFSCVRAKAYSLPAAMRRCCMQERVARLSKLLCCIWPHPYCSRQLAAADRRFLVFLPDTLKVFALAKTKKRHALKNTQFT